MRVLSDTEELARQWFPERSWGPAEPTDRAGLGPALDELFDQPRALIAAPPAARGEGTAPFEALLLRGHAPTSQFDVLVELSRQGLSLPELVAVAGAGDGFHGHQGRGWVARSGNLHVSVLLCPRRAMRHAGAAFMALPAVAAADAVAAHSEVTGRLRIKWVNDVLVDGAKISGVLTHMASAGARIDHVVLGIGLNVKARPDVARDPFVPAVTHLQAVNPAASPGAVLRTLLERLGERYQALLRDGPLPLIEDYRRLALYPGESVEVRQGEQLLARGTVARLDDDLRLFLNEQTAPVVSGRLILG